MNSNTTREGLRPIETPVENVRLLNKIASGIEISKAETVEFMESRPMPSVSESFALRLVRIFKFSGEDAPVSKWRLRFLKARLSHSIFDDLTGSLRILGKPVTYRDVKRLSKRSKSLRVARTELLQEISDSEKLARQTNAQKTV